MSLRNDVLDVIHSDLRALVNLNVFAVNDHIDRMDFARELALPHLITYMGKTHTEAIAYQLDHEVYRQAS